MSIEDQILISMFGEMQLEKFRMTVAIAKGQAGEQKLREALSAAEREICTLVEAGREDRDIAPAPERPGPT